MTTDERKHYIRRMAKRAAFDHMRRMQPEAYVEMYAEVHWPEYVLVAEGFLEAVLKLRG